jgi:thimet oligopeptidase
MGFALPDEKFNRLKAISEELNILTSEFGKAIADYEDSILVTREQLDGLPENFIARLQLEPDGRFRISLDYPSYGPFMQYAHDDGARRELDRKKWRKGGEGNLERLAHMIRLRQEYAGLLGYATHADFVAEERMAKSSAAVHAFLGSILGKLKPAVNSDLRDLVDIKRRVLKLEKPSPIQSHEVSYWSNRLRKERYDLDAEVIRQHFPAARVLDGMMKMYEELLGVRFTEVSGAALWHPSAKMYEVQDAASGDSQGHFALDLYPRKGKYDHYAAFPITLADESSGSAAGFMVLVCNFPPPSGDIPSLLSHYEVETLFHEFGHVMHALLSSGCWQRQNGFGVAKDFIEALSQIFEYWAWHPEVLTRVSRHYRTGKSLSQDLIAKMLAARRFMDGMFYNGQAVMALYDLMMHGQPTDAPVSSAALSQLHRDMKLQYEHMDVPEDAIYAAGWGHMADYDAGYYGYLWSKVYAADMFTKFAAQPLSPVIGAEYRAKVLAPGASLPELALVRGFLGREPSDAAFLAELGID